MVLGTASKVVEPKHRMYLNIENNKSSHKSCGVEPKHRMYLNYNAAIGPSFILSVEPKHRMYLNEKMIMFM